jgi:hypothetical protein
MLKSRNGEIGETTKDAKYAEEGFLSLWRAKRKKIVHHGKH